MGFCYSEILYSEARRHYGLSQLASDPIIRDGHLETMLALWVAAEMMREEGKEACRDFRKSEKKRPLRLRPLRQDCRKVIPEQQEAR